MPDDLYDRDILIWSERQADFLRRLAAGERMNADIDWPNVIEEVESVGRSELHRVQSLVVQTLRHLLKLHLSPDSDARHHWREQIATFLIDAQLAYTPSMHQRLDIGDLWRKALRATPAQRAVPTRCPYTLDDLVADDPDIDALIARLDE